MKNFSAVCRLPFLTESATEQEVFYSRRRLKGYPQPAKAVPYYGPEQSYASGFLA